MTLNDAIEYYSKIAETLRKQVRIEDNDYMDKVDEVYTCEQLAEWLNELKLLRERIDAQQEQRWIPCKNRLPKEEKASYWVCTDAGYQFECRWTNVNHLFTNLTMKWHWHVMDVPQYSTVVAWMPLQEPYGGEQE